MVDDSNWCVKEKEKKAFIEDECVHMRVPNIFLSLIEKKIKMIHEREIKTG